MENPIKMDDFEEKPLFSETSTLNTKPRAHLHLTPGVLCTCALIHPLEQGETSWVDVEDAAPNTTQGDTVFEDGVSFLNNR